MFAVPAAIVTAVLVAFYLQQSLRAGEWLGGGSIAGLICGIAAAAVIVFEMLLWPRKILRRLRLIPAKYWLAAHLWLGIASLPLAVVHCGFHLGGWLPTILMIVFLLTIGSGLYGFAVQNILPRWMLNNLSAETIYNQIDYVSQQTVNDAERMLLVAGGESQSADPEPELERAAEGPVVVGAIRQAGRTRGRTVETRHLSAVREDSQQLWTALEEIRPYLLGGVGAETPVTEQQQADVWFGKLRSVCQSESEPIINALEGMCDQRRQFDVQQTVHRWLHVWLPLHIAFSIAVTVLLAAHIWTALKYW